MPLAVARRSSGPVVEPIDLLRYSGAFERNNRDKVPDIIEFITGEQWLNRGDILYPRQATFLKIIFLELENLTAYDMRVIEEWSRGFILPNEPVRSLDPSQEPVTKFVGDWGIQPDVLERMQTLRDAGYRWFKHVLAVLGRRSAKGYMGSLAGAYVLWNYIQAGDTRQFYGIDRDKRLASQVFAGKKMQARDNQWRDLVNVINGAPCFQQYISTSLVESLTVYSNTDIRQQARAIGHETAMDMATFEVVPKEATTMAARGPASFMQFYDEMAHMVATSGSSRAAAEVYDAAEPSLDQFGIDGFIYCGSSPWEMIGKFYELCQQALELNGETYEPVYPSSLLLQLASWDIYLDFELTAIEGSPMVARPGYWWEPLDEHGNSKVPASEAGQWPKWREPIYFKPLKKAIQSYDDDMRQKERANPETFRVERRSKWATAMDSYFNSAHVARMFDPWPDPDGPKLEQQNHGSPLVSYVVHGDPGKTGSNFGFCIGHKIMVPGTDLPHVVIDVVKAWTRQDFPNRFTDPDNIIDNEMDYTAIEAEMKWYIDQFLPVDFSLDQWNSIGILQRLQAHGRKNYKVPIVWERTATAGLNWQTAETMKTALSMNLVHSPYNELFDLEMLFLRKVPGSNKVDHPMAGPVTTKDVYDAVSIVVYKLIGGDVAAFMGEQLSDLSLVTGMPGPNSPNAPHNPAEAGTNQSNQTDIQRQFGQFRQASQASRRGQMTGQRPRR